MRGVPRDRRAISQAPSVSICDLEDAGCTLDDRLEFVVLVVVEPGDEPEPVAQRPGDHARARRGPDERERRHREPDARRGRALADDDVELEVLHRRIQDLLDRPRQPVDLVDEQHVAVFELGEDRGEVAGAFECRTRRDVQVHSHLGGHDARPSVVLPSPGGPANSRWSTDCPRLRAASSTMRRCSLSSRWPTNSSSARGRSPASSSTSARSDRRRSHRCPGRGTRHARRAPSAFRASRNSVAASASVGSSRSTSRISSVP